MLWCVYMYVAIFRLFSTSLYLIISNSCKYMHIHKDNGLSVYNMVPRIHTIKKHWKSLEELRVRCIVPYRQQWRSQV